MEQVLYKKEDGIAVISIVRPEALNALSRGIIDKIDDYIVEISKDDEIRALIFYSEGNFASGADIKGMADCNEKEALDFTFTPTYNKISALSIPTIAAIEGYALGGGLELALTADIRIASAKAKMGFPEVTLGIFPGAGGTIRAPRLCGPALAKEMIFTGSAIDAQRALQIGLVNSVVDEGQTFEAALKMAKTIAKRGPVAIRKVKEVINKGLEEQSIEVATKMEAEKWASLFTSYDQKEGMRAFIEKRKPEFKNK